MIYPGEPSIWFKKILVGKRPSALPSLLGTASYAHPIGEEPDIHAVRAAARARAPILARDGRAAVRRDQILETSLLELLLGDLPAATSSSSSSSSSTTKTTKTTGGGSLDGAGDFRGEGVGGQDGAVRGEAKEVVIREGEGAGGVFLGERGEEGGEVTVATRGRLVGGWGFSLEGGGGGDGLKESQLESHYGKGRLRERERKREKWRELTAVKKARMILEKRMVAVGSDL